MSHFTYILYSPSLKKFYKGSTSDIDQRLARHNARREKSTQHGAPWTLLWTDQKESKSEVIKLEYKLKNLSQKRLVDFMLKYADGVASPDALLFLKQWSGC